MGCGSIPPLRRDRRHVHCGPGGRVGRRPEQVWRAGTFRENGQIQPVAAHRGIVGEEGEICRIMIPAGDRLRKVVLIVNDGWGIAKAGKGNYITQAKTPNMDFYWKKYPHTLNKPHGAAVGLPEGSQRSEEVGHLHLGAGRVVWQMYEKINRTIKD